MVFYYAQTTGLIYVCRLIVTANKRKSLGRKT